MRRRSRPARAFLAAAWLALSVNAGLEDPSCPHHGAAPVGGEVGPAAHAHTEPAGSTGRSPAGHPGESEGEAGQAGCRCLGVCVPAALSAAPAARGPVVPPQTTAGTLAARAMAESPLLRPVPYLLPFATAPPRFS